MLENLLSIIKKLDIIIFFYMITMIKMVKILKKLLMIILKVDLLKLLIIEKEITKQNPFLTLIKIAIQKTKICIIGFLFTIWTNF